MENKKLNDIVDFLRDQLKSEELIILESQFADHASSELSYIASKPVSSISAFGNKITIREDGDTRIFEMAPWDALKEYQAQKKNWLFGYLGYDLKDYIEKLRSTHPSSDQIPDYYFMEPSLLLKVEKGGIKTILGRIPEGNTEEEILSTGLIESMNSEMEEEEYVKKVLMIKEMIREGDFYELNFSYPITGNYKGDPYWLYQKMRDINPVPFGSFIQIPGLSICCASPERFLKKKGNRILSEPIKGTSARSLEPLADEIQKELLMNEKNRAENLMIVDLVRHDLSAVAKTGSVRVSKLYDIQTFGTVHQLISAVEAEVEDHVNPVEIVKACFPMGSMTGAPKIKVMNTIDELETYRRGIYSGAIGYFNPDGDFDFNVVIRTAIVQNNSYIYPVGGAITSDSDPVNEWEETKIKSVMIRNVLAKNGIDSK
jgi:para-aminobenzoate synthetase component 1